MRQVFSRFFDPPIGPHQVLLRLQEAGHKAVFVGGCVRDSLLGVRPHDWDIATSATPSVVESLFPGAIPVGVLFGTVIVLSPEPVEVTTFRRELGYADGRHPDTVVFTHSLDEDLQRRDFTINAMAFDPTSNELFDPVGGQYDLEERLIRAVGDPQTRFREDALRLLRAVRFACRLKFDIETETWDAALSLVQTIDHLSRERVRDELVKTLATPDPDRGLWMLYELGILLRILPELRGSERLEQGKRGAPTLLDHLVQAVAACPADPILRLTGLLHDVGKLTTRQVTPEGRVVFYGHEEEGARIAQKVLQRLCFENTIRARVLSLIRNHMATGPITKKLLRRWLGTHGEEWVWNLLDLRRADHTASGGDTAPWLDAAADDFREILAAEGALHLSDLEVNGNDIMRALSIEAGPIVGKLLSDLFDIVLMDPSENNRDLLLNHARRLWDEHQVGQG